MDKLKPVIVNGVEYFPREFQADQGKHFCETNEGWRPCPANLCEANVLHEQVKFLRRKVASTAGERDRLNSELEQMRR